MVCSQVKKGNFVVHKISMHYSIVANISHARTILHICVLQAMIMIWETKGMMYDEKRTQDELIDRCYYNDGNFIHARLSSQESLLTQETTAGFAYEPVHTSGDNVHSMNRNSYHMMLQLITESLVGSTQLSETCYSKNCNNNDTDAIEDSSNNKVPTMNNVLQQVEKEQGTQLDEKQLVTYRSICATFLLGLIHDGLNSETMLGQYFETLAGNIEVTTSANNLSKIIQTKLMSVGGRRQLVMFLTGPAGAGKTTAVKMAETFCFLFCRAISVIWQDNTFLFTAYTGSAASAFGELPLAPLRF